MKNINLKKILLPLGAVALIGGTATAVVACNNNNETKEIEYPVIKLADIFVKTELTEISHSNSKDKGKTLYDVTYEQIEAVLLKFGIKFDNSDWYVWIHENNKTMLIKYIPSKTEWETPYKFID